MSEKCSQPTNKLLTNFTIDYILTKCGTQQNESPKSFLQFHPLCSKVSLNVEDKIRFKRFYECGKCFKMFSQRRNFKYHMSAHLGSQEFIAICPVCGKCMKDRGYLSSHMKIHE